MPNGLSVILQDSSSSRPGDGGEVASNGKSSAQAARPAQVLQQLCILSTAADYAEDLVTILAQVPQHSFHQLCIIVRQKADGVARLILHAAALDVHLHMQHLPQSDLFLCI